MFLAGCGEQSGQGEDLLVSGFHLVAFREAHIDGMNSGVDICYGASYHDIGAGGTGFQVGRFSGGEAYGVLLGRYDSRVR